MFVDNGCIFLFASDEVLKFYNMYDKLQHCSFHNKMLLLLITPKMFQWVNVKLRLNSNHTFSQNVTF